MSTFRRSAAVVAAGAAVFTLAGAFAGVAGAETVGPATGESNSMKFQRSVSADAIVDGKVRVGDTITVTNRFDRKVGWTLSEVTDTHPTCFEAVPQTSVWTVSGKTYNNIVGSPGYKNEFTSGAGWTKLDPPLLWGADPLIWTQDYVVNCEVGDLHTGGVAWKSSNALEDKNKFPDAGPTITVVKSSTPGGGGDGGGSGGSGSLDTGSLGSLFG
ncbi:hypothetical protein [Gordonia sp. (in: high G+C Gram-positive bacteria)]|uniref:hypothetical protein n=1 Tax=Gordonia sp. (in: high G+C Gram-positive bacteria) TaxID=84139 RepID=UPI0016ABE34F|nr:hypothetical protein [Gordonia sp. (in: high G+C Gram-positive bacteria)]NLG46992.1 hypothetical protein [Gordonia sp. (in: high G+C Gram-positive bacteria)]